MATIIQECSTVPQHFQRAPKGERVRHTSCPVTPSEHNTKRSYLFGKLQTKNASTQTDGKMGFTHTKLKTIQSICSSKCLYCVLRRGIIQGYCVFS